MGDFVAAESAVSQHADGIFNLAGLAGANQHRSHAIAAQYPGQRHLRQFLPTLLRQRIKLAHLFQFCVGELIRLQELAAAGCA